MENSFNIPVHNYYQKQDYISDTTDLQQLNTLDNINSLIDASSTSNAETVTVETSEAAIQTATMASDLKTTKSSSEMSSNQNTHTEVESINDHSHFTELTDYHDQNNLNDNSTLDNNNSYPQQQPQQPQQLDTSNDSNYTISNNPIPNNSNVIPDQPYYVNAKQYHRILKRRIARAKLEEALKIQRVRKPYLHESRHKHAMRRPRGQGGRFLTAAEIAELEKKENENSNSSIEADSLINDENKTDNIIKTNS